MPPGDVAWHKPYAESKRVKRQWRRTFLLSCFFFFFISFWPYTVAFYKELTFLFSSISLWYHFVDQVLCLLALPQANLSFPLCDRFFIDKPKLFSCQGEKSQSWDLFSLSCITFPISMQLEMFSIKIQKNLIESRGVFAGHGSWWREDRWVRCGTQLTVSVMVSEQGSFGAKSEKFSQGWVRCLIGLVRITSWYPNFNGSHFGLPPSEINKMTGLPPKIVRTMTMMTFRTGPIGPELAKENMLTVMWQCLGRSTHRYQCMFNTWQSCRYGQPMKEGIICLFGHWR